ncbi:MAG: hypothetical protein LE179_04995, partial [Endomicrobium sp.]|nr:hypothetical protein [Endomicrobium sp.]
APLGNNKESASVEKLQEEASEVLETSKSYLESGYGFARNHWKPLTAVIVAAVLCAVGYHYGVHQHMYEGIAKVPEKAKGAWGWITSKFKKAPESKSADTDKKKTPKTPAEPDKEPEPVVIPKTPSETPSTKEPKDTTSSYSEEINEEEDKTDKEPKPLISDVPKVSREYEGKDEYVVMHEREEGDNVFIPFNQEVGVKMELRHSVPKPAVLSSKSSAKPPIYILSGVKSRTSAPIKKTLL